MERKRWKAWGAALAGLLLPLLLLAPGRARADEFDDDLARVDAAIAKNPSHVLQAAVDSCARQRDTAVRLYQVNEVARAERALHYCFEVLEVSEKPPRAATAVTERTMAEVQAQAAREVERAETLTPDVEHGLAVYRECAGCHMPEGWGLQNGSVPQIAGQHRSVVIKQLADIRAGNRDTFLMLPYASAEAIGGAQSVADVAAYIDTLEISVENGKGPGQDLALGEKLYAAKCASCHGASGEGNEEKRVPRIQSQHYRYLVTQFERIRDGQRRNADPQMVAQIGGLTDREIHAILDYVSRQEPPETFRAPTGWHNPDF